MSDDRENIPINEHGLHLTNYDQLLRVANLLHKAGTVPSFKTVEQLMVGLLRAIELKLPPLQAIEGMSVIAGKIGMMGDLTLSMVEASGLLEDRKVKYTGQGDSLVCTITLKRKGHTAQEYSYSVQEAKEAGIYGRNSNWRSYPKRMTYYRALGFGLRDEFADVTKGIKTTEELQDYPDAVPESRYANDRYDDEEKVTENRAREEELLKKAKTEGVHVVENKATRKPSPAEATAPMDQPPHPPKPVPAPVPQQAPAPPPLEPDADDLNMEPSQPPQPPSAEDAAGSLAWRDHVIQGLRNPKYLNRKVGDLTSVELGAAQEQWLPKVKEKLDQGERINPLQLKDAEALEAAIKYYALEKPW